MNIIVGNDKSVRLTQYSSQSTYNLLDINFYIANTLGSKVESVSLIPEDSMTTYTFPLHQTAGTVNYNILQVYFTTNVNLSARTYTFVLNLTTDNSIETLTAGAFMIEAIEYKLPQNSLFRMAKVSVVEDNGFGGEYYVAGETAGTISDEHEPVDVDLKAREIHFSNNQNVLVQEDNISQAITFRFQRYYDGIDLADENIPFYVDYLDPTMKDETFNPDGVVSIEINADSFSSVYIVQREIDGELKDFIYLHWVVPFSITKKAGKVTMALAFGIQNGDHIYGYEGTYLLQTKATTLQIVPNIGHKQNGTSTPEGEINVVTEIKEELVKVNETLEEIQSSDSYNIDSDDDDDNGVVYIDAGGAL